jgi:metallo-beta-lactamase class B
MIRHLLLTLLLAPSLLAQSDPVSRAWNEPVEPFRIAGNVWYVGAADITSYLITTPKGHIVIDGGFVETAPIILASIEKLGFEPTDVRILLNSHAHYDHAGGLLELRRVTGAALHASRFEIPLLARGGLGDPQFGDRFPFPPIEADRIVEDGAQIRLGGTTLTAHVTPGHTRGCTTWTTTVEEKGKKLDVVFLCSSSVPTDYRLRGNPFYPDAIDDYRRNFSILKALRPDVFLASHGAFFNLTEKREGKRSFIDPDGYREYVEAAEQRFEARAAQ